jgi:hypothetical protein
MDKALYTRAIKLRLDKDSLLGEKSNYLILLYETFGKY